MVHLDEAEVKGLIEDVVRCEGIEVKKVHVRAGSEKGDGYYGVLTAVDIEGKDGDLHLILKSAPRDEELRKMPCIRDIYVREIAFYKDVAPVLLAFQEERYVDEPFAALAKCYKTVSEVNKEVVVLENMKSKGFQLYDCKKAMDVEHVSFVLKQYGKFHALSLGLWDQDHILFIDLTKGMDNIFKKANCTDEQYGVFTGIAEKLKKLFDPEKEKGVLRAVNELAATMKDYVDTFEDAYTGEYAVLTHGDCWGNNLLFRYQDPENPNRPTDLCLLDFQLAKPASPVLDVSYFFYAMASKEMLDNLDHYLRIYHKSLGDHLRELGSDVEKLYPFSALKAEWNKYAKFGFVMSLVVLKAMLREKDEVVDFTDGNDDGKTFISAFEDDIRSEAFAERQRNLVLHAFEIGII